MKASELRGLVLRVLAAGDAYGLEVIDRVNAIAGRDVLGQGNAYALLREMESEQLIDSYARSDGAGDVARGGRPRRYYRLRDPRPNVYVCFDSVEKIAAGAVVELRAELAIAVKWTGVLIGPSTFVLEGVPEPGTEFHKGAEIVIRVGNPAKVGRRFLLTADCVVLEPPRRATA